MKLCVGIVFRGVVVGGDDDDDDDDDDSGDVTDRCISVFSISVERESNDGERVQHQLESDSIAQGMRPSLNLISSSTLTLTLQAS
jgi:hypothetical protein